MESLEEAKTWLRNTPLVLDSNVDEILQEIADFKKKALSLEAEHDANGAWCYETLIRIRITYEKLFRELKDGNFESAWHLIEETRNAVFFLDRVVVNGAPELAQLIDRHCKQFESLFPFKLFISPEMIIGGMNCGICGQSLTPYSFCNHRAGQLYGGEMCSHEITEIKEVVCMVLVSNPVHKYSFLKAEGITPNYSAIAFATSLLPGPYFDWKIDWTTRRVSHSKFKDISEEDLCPCGSMKTYRECCLQNSEGVLKPHANILCINFEPEGGDRDFYFE